MVVDIHVAKRSQNRLRRADQLDDAGGLVTDLRRKLRLFAVRALAPQQIEPAQSERPDPDEHLVSDRLGPANVLDP